MTAKSIPRLLAISDLASGEVSPDFWFRMLAEAGSSDSGRIDTVLIREKALTDLDGLRLLEQARQALGSSRQILVSTRVDLAIAARTAGVHLPSSSVPASAIRQRFGHRLLIGQSTHHPEEVAEAKAAGVDYVTFGPVFDTPSKRVYGTPTGLEGLGQAVRQGLPVLALGGIGPNQMAEVAKAGAAGIAGIRAFQSRRGLLEMTDLRRRLWP